MESPHAAPGFIRDHNLRLILVGGKGGVGKTTLAAAIAYSHAMVHSRRVLILSTDPAHSLSDCFGITIGDEITPILGMGVRYITSSLGPRSSDTNNLFAWEMDAHRLLADFKKQHGETLKILADRGTFFDQQDITAFLDLSLPGMDELMAVLEIARLVKEAPYDLVVVDTAPTGHTVRMLELPRHMKQWIYLLDLMQQKHRYLAEQFSRRRYRKDIYDRFLDDLSSKIRGLEKILTNPKITRFVPVLIPETMVIEETEKLLHALKRQGIPVRDIIINRVNQTEKDCPFCERRHAAQKESLAEIQRRFQGYDLIHIQELFEEPRFEAVSACLTSGLDLGLRTSNLRVQISGFGARPSSLEPRRGNPWPLSLNPELEFILFGGKGGVGKTTLASAAALFLASRYPVKKILLFSTDPAHSLSDAWQIPIGDKITPIAYAANPPTNLFALEIDAEKHFEEFKERFRREIEEIFERFLVRGMDVQFDRQVMTELFNAAPPGLDEIMALESIMKMQDQKTHDIFVLDTSPTGHLLRFLELPDLGQRWLKVLFTLLLKYKGVVSLGKTAEQVLDLSRRIRKIQEALTDELRTQFIAVMRPEQMVLQETYRLINRLKTSGIHCQQLIVNGMVPEHGCPTCALRRVQAQKQVQQLRDQLPHMDILTLPLMDHAVQGVHDLKRMAELAFGDG